MNGKLLIDPAGVASVGVSLFAEELSRHGVVVERVDWRPAPTDGRLALNRLALLAQRINRANDLAVQLMQESQPKLIGVRPAREVIGALEPGAFLHAGPPVGWAAMSGPLRGAIIGASMYEGLSQDPDDAVRQAETGRFKFIPCHDYQSVGPMAGVVSPSMPLWIVRNEGGGNVAYSTLNEGLGRVLRYGAFDQQVLERLRWMERVLAPILDDALQKLDSPLDLRALMAQALQMGDELHNRNRAATSLFLRELFPALLETRESTQNLLDAVRFISHNDHFFLNLSMAAAKATADAAAGVPCSSIVVAMARNGTEFGIRLSGTGSRWFTGPAGEVSGLYFPGFGPENASRDIGDSTITETIGLGGFAMAAAPAIIQFVGGTQGSAEFLTRSMYEITWSESQMYRIPQLGFRGTPLGIDCREVVHTGILPAINTGIAHKEPGVGQIGAGMVAPPAEAFIAALKGLAEVARS